jgi:hypothetical protein
VRRARIVLLVVLAGAAVGAGTAPSAAQELADVTRPCRAADLLGAWEVIRLGTAAGVRVDRSDPAFYPHQRYVFYKNATLRYLASQTRITAESQRALLATAAVGTWAVDDGGRLLVLHEGEARLDRSACLVLVKEVQDPKNRARSLAGDVLLTTYDAAGQSALRRQLRKLGGAPE